MFVDWDFGDDYLPENQHYDTPRPEGSWWHNAGDIDYLDLIRDQQDCRCGDCPECTDS